MADPVVNSTVPAIQKVNWPQEVVGVSVRIFDGSGNLISTTNPLPVTLEASPGTVTDVNLLQVGGTTATSGAGAVTAGTQRTTLASDDPAVSVLGATSGAKVITDANGTIQQYLRGFISQWISSTLTFASQGLGSAVSLTRTNDTNPYTINDVIGSATGSTAALTFAVAATGENIITSIALEIDESAVISGEAGYRLHLYNITPPSALGDNAAWDLPSGDRASYLGFVDFGQPVDLGSTCYIETNGINKQITSISGNVFGYLVTLGAYTPTASLVYKSTMHTIKV